MEEVDSSCQYSFLLEESLANLAKVLYYHDQQLNFDEVDSPLLHVTGIPLARQDLLAHGLSFGVWGYLASMVGTEQTSLSIKSNLFQLLPSFINRVATAQATGQPISWDKELMTLVSSDGVF